MATSLVEQLQQDALDPTTSVSNLLRKVKLTAVKLGQGEVAAWVDMELHGFPLQNTVRRIHDI
ncbi:MAG: hypothetical protein JWO83_359 [Caulobacteraceae bacterium]|nr:hypothetical protein [Caulobacteraceae bacterium]